jgi:hypothetical protein
VAQLAATTRGRGASQRLPPAAACGLRRPLAPSCDRRRRGRSPLTLRVLLRPWCGPGRVSLPPCALRCPACSLCSPLSVLGRALPPRPSVVLRVGGGWRLVRPPSLPRSSAAARLVLRGVFGSSVWAWVFCGAPRCAAALVCSSRAACCPPLLRWRARSRRAALHVRSPSLLWRWCGAWGVFCRLPALPPEALSPDLDGPWRRTRRSGEGRQMPDSA